jgi:hypothetical protein
MNDIIANLAQELADHLDDLRDSGGGVTNYSEDTGLGPAVEDHEVTEVSDAETDMNLDSVLFYVVVDGQRVRVMVSAA